MLVDILINNCSTNDQMTRPERPMCSITERLRAPSQVRVDLFTDMGYYPFGGEWDCCPAWRREAAAPFGADPLRIAGRDVECSLPYECDATSLDPKHVSETGFGHCDVVQLLGISYSCLISTTNAPGG